MRFTILRLLVAAGALLVATRGASDGSVPPAVDEAKLVWRKANLTNYSSFPAPDTEECIAYNGCTWSGQFAALDQRQTEQWVRKHNIIAVHEKDFATYKLHTLRLRSGKSRIDAVVYDLCSDSDCGGCCTTNAAQHGLDFLIDIESHTMRRFDGIGDGIVEWACIDC